jgi:hypothetical protein
MRVKIFHKSIKGNPDTAVKAIESEMNEWFTENPDNEIVDIRFSSSSSSVERIESLFSVFCLVLFKRRF